jgi:ferredoxin-NADP reductase
MATARSARVIGVEQISDDTRLVELEMPEPLAFIGGQYVIVDSGRVLPSGKAVKRAYSLVSCDAEQRRFQLAVKRLGEGPCSSFVHELPLGAEIRFSGPWGKMFPAEGASGATLVLSTDTGVSAGLGLVQSVRFAPLVAGTTFVWLRTAPDYFLPDDVVRARVPAGCAELRIERVPAIDHPERVAFVRALVAARLARGPIAQAFIAGDGAVNYALLDDLVAAGVRATRDSVESFFNMPKKST